LFDPERFGSLVEAMVNRDGRSVRAVARALDMSHATLWRVISGKQPSVETYLRLQHWLAAEGKRKRKP
jgi:predicted transcriptional regulator